MEDVRQWLESYKKQLVLAGAAAMVLAPRLGLPGVWIAMCGELCIRGILFLVRLLRGKWLEERHAVSGALKS